MPRPQEASATLCEALREILREARIEADLSLNELGKRSGVDRNAISFVEQGRRIPSVETLAKISFGLGLPASLLWQKAERRALGNKGK